jgi:ubiquinone/menaquinone biosynthesis C-methylase UbiE
MDCSLYYDKVGVKERLERDMIRFQQTFPHILTEGSLLDVGCGPGAWLNYVSEITDLVLSGMDISKVRLSHAIELLEDKAINLSIGDIRHLPFTDNQFTQTTAMEVIEHIPEWQVALSEIIRVSSDRIVITVPYKERLKSETCDNCGSEAYLSGHLHSFTEKDFQYLSADCRISFEMLPPQYGLNHYVKRAISGVIRKTTSNFSERENGHSLSTVCQNCYEEVPYTKYAERAIQRLERIIKRTPEYLLIKIEK